MRLTDRRALIRKPPATGGKESTYEELRQIHGSEQAGERIEQLRDAAVRTRGSAGMAELFWKRQSLNENIYGKSHQFRAHVNVRAHTN